MIIRKPLRKFHFRSNLLKLIVYFIIVALTISLWMILIFRVFNFAVNPGIPSVIGVIGAAAYAARIRTKMKAIKS